MRRSFRVTCPAFLAVVLGRYQRSSPLLLRVGVGVLYLWFGALKLVPGLSPVDQLATRSMAVMTGGLVPADVSRPLLALMELLIGVGLVTGFLLRLTLITFFVHMTGIFLTLALLPHQVWTHPLVPTMEGQYILKNVVLVLACLQVAAIEFSARRPIDLTSDQAAVPARSAG